jgi:hypothetical protein
MTRRREATPTGGDLSSTCLSEFDYDPDRRVLGVTFAESGAHYRYFNVPQNVVTGLRESNSKGRYFNARIKPAFKYSRGGGGYAYRRPR